METDQLDWTFTEGGEPELQYAVELYGRPLLKYCHNILCDYYEAQDVVQITFIKAYEKRKRFKKGTSLSAWLYRIAYTTCMDHLRKKKILFFSPPVKTQQEYMGADLKKALKGLTPLERALIFNRVVDEKSYADLEAIYQIPAATLRKRYERAKKKLAKELKETNSYYERLGVIK